MFLEFLKCQNILVLNDQIFQLILINDQIMTKISLKNLTKNQIHKIHNIHRIHNIHIIHDILDIHDIHNILKMTKNQKLMFTDQFIIFMIHNIIIITLQIKILMMILQFLKMIQYMIYLTLDKILIDKILISFLTKKSLQTKHNQILKMNNHHKLIIIKFQFKIQMKTPINLKIRHRMILNTPRILIIKKNNLFLKKFLTNHQMKLKIICHHML